MSLLKYIFSTTQYFPMALSIVCIAELEYALGIDPVSLHGFLFSLPFCMLASYMFVGREEKK